MFVCLLFFRLKSITTALLVLVTPRRLDQVRIPAGRHFGSSYFQPLTLVSHQGVKLTLSGLVDGKNINAGGHKLGLGLELEA